MSEKGLRGIGLKGEITIELVKVLVYGQNLGSRSGEFIEKSADQILSAVVEVLPNPGQAETADDYQERVIAAIKGGE